MERSLSACRPVETRRYRAARTGTVMAISPRSVAGGEQLVEQVAEPGLEHLDLGLGHRHVLGPIILHGPPARIIGRRPAGAPGRRARVVVKIVSRHISGREILAS